MRLSIYDCLKHYSGDIPQDPTLFTDDKLIYNAAQIFLKLMVSILIFIRSLASKAKMKFPNNKGNSNRLKKDSIIHISKITMEPMVTIKSKMPTVI